MAYQSNILLTGAGFSANFGSPLADEVWSLILASSALRDAPRVFAAVQRQETPDFESVYHEVISGDSYSTSDKHAMQAAVAGAFDFVDDALRTWDHETHRVSVYRVRDLLAQFAGRPLATGMIFTVNQDLFVERYYADGPPLLLPGFNRTVNISGDARTRLEREHILRVPEAPVNIDFEVRRHSFCYVKLHGSYNWRRSYGSTNESYMVIGRGKAEQVKSDPLLAQYFDLFQKVLSAGQRRLLVCGYSFRDPHVNEAIAKAVREADLQVFVMSPQRPEAFRRTLSGLPEGPAILTGLSGYYPYSFERIFPASNADSPARRNLLATYFGA